MAVRQRVKRICEEGLDERPLRSAVLAELRRDVPFDAYVWLLTDPETCVGSAPLAETPSLADLPALIRLRYLTPANRWTTLPSGTAATLMGSANSDCAASAMWRQMLAGYGIDDVVSTVFRDMYGCWGFLELWRAGGSFSADECRLLSDLGPVVTRSSRLSQMTAFAGRSAALDPESGPAVLLLSDSLDLLSRTPQTDTYLRALLPTAADRSPVPAAAYNVAAQLLAQENEVDLHPPSARVHLGNGRWVTLRAARIERRSSVDSATIAVSIEATRPIERAALYGRVAGLSEREAQLLRHLVEGSDTRELAQRLFVSQHTVQDHLKSIFAKTGVNSRRVLIARATGLA